MNALPSKERSDDVQRGLGNCPVSESLRVVYKDSMDMIVGHTWIIHLLRLIEDGKDMSKYLNDPTFLNTLRSHIAILSDEHKDILKWKIKFLRRHKLESKVSACLDIISDRI